MQHRNRNLRHHGAVRRAGYTLLELTFSMMFFVVIMMSTLGMLERDTKLAQSVLATTHVEQLAQELIYRLKKELANAQGWNPVAVITEAVDDTDTGSLRVDSTLGFPSSGIVVLNRGTTTEERIAYSNLENTEEYFNNLERGLQCTTAAEHDVGDQLIWQGLAEPIAQQDSPAPENYDGVTMGVLGPVYFRGDGTGFVYRNPIDPTGGQNLLDGDKLMWGQNVNNTPQIDGWAALTFEPRHLFSEAKTGQDLNRDGDRLDEFDVGIIRRTRWVSGNAAFEVDSINMGPAAVLQERCNYGGDLDGDGFDDPIFLWDENQRQLSIRLFVVGGMSNGKPIMRRVESTIFLRNEVEI